MTVNAGTFIHDMMESLGFRNAASVLDGRYPALDDAAIAAPNIVVRTISI